MFVKMLLSAMKKIVPWIMPGIVPWRKKRTSCVSDSIRLSPATRWGIITLSAMLVHHAASFIKNTISNPPHPTNTAAAPPSGPLA